MGEGCKLPNTRQRCHGHRRYLPLIPSSSFPGSPRGMRMRRALFVHALSMGSPTTHPPGRELQLHWWQRDAFRQAERWNCTASIGLGSGSGSGSCSWTTWGV